MTLPVIPTRSAHWGWDEHQYFGHAVFGELAGNESLTGMVALSVLGRRLERADMHHSRYGLRRNLRWRLLRQIQRCRGRLQSLDLEHDTYLCQ